MRRLYWNMGLRGRDAADDASFRGRGFVGPVRAEIDEYGGGWVRLGGFVCFCSCFRGGATRRELEGVYFRVKAETAARSGLGCW